MEVGSKVLKGLGDRFIKGNGVAECHRCVVCLNLGWLHT